MTSRVPPGFNFTSQISEHPSQQPIQSNSLQTQVHVPPPMLTFPQAGNQQFDAHLATQMFNRIYTLINFDYGPTIGNQATILRTREVSRLVFESLNTGRDALTGQPFRVDPQGVIQFNVQYGPSVQSMPPSNSIQMREPFNRPPIPQGYSQQRHIAQPSLSPDQFMQRSSLAPHGAPSSQPMQRSGYSLQGPDAQPSVAPHPFMQGSHPVQHGAPTKDPMQQYRERPGFVNLEGPYDGPPNSQNPTSGHYPQRPAVHLQIDVDQTMPELVPMQPSSTYRTPRQEEVIAQYQTSPSVPELDLNDQYDITFEALARPFPKSTLFTSPLEKTLSSVEFGDEDEVNQLVDFVVGGKDLQEEDTN